MTTTPAAARMEMGAGRRFVVLRPERGASMRSLELALVRGGLGAKAVRRDETWCLPVADVNALLSLLKGWEVVLSQDLEEEVRRTARVQGANYRAKRAIERLGAPGEAAAALADFPDASRLDPHQVHAVAVASHPDVSGLCLFDEQGLGKTVMALFAFHRLRQSGGATRALVVAPKSMVPEWAQEVERLLPGQYVTATVVGSVREKRALLERPADIYVTNFETVIRLTSRLADLLIAEQGRGLLVIDESFLVKNEAARRTRAVRELRPLAGRCWVLCGTPAPNRPHDLVAQVSIADGGAAFADVALPESRADAGVVVQRVLREKGVYLRRLKVDALPDLPGRTFSRVLVPLEPVQASAYRRAIHGLIKDLRATDDKTFRRQLASFAARRMALLQLCSVPTSVMPGYNETPGKLRALDAILEELVVHRREKVVVWSFFTAAVDAICQRYARMGLVRYDGAVEDTGVRRESVRRFQEDDATMLFIGNPAAAGAGLTLHRARYAIYESMSNQAAHYLQSLDRLHRRGQTRAVEYLVLLSEGSIEVQEYERLIGKERAAKELLGDVSAEPVTRVAMLKELVDAQRLLRGAGRAEDGRDE